MPKIKRHSRSASSLEKQINSLNSIESTQIFLRFSLAVLMLGASAAAIGLQVFAPNQPVRLLAPLSGFLIALAGWYFLHQGRIQATINVLIFGTWLVATATAVFTDGVRAPVVMAYPILILCSAWLISARAALLLAGLTAIATLILMVSDSSGLLPKFLPSTLVMHVGDQLVIYLLSAVLAVYLVRSYQRRLDELYKIGRELAHRTADLETSKSELDQAQVVAKVGSWVYDFASGTMHLSAETCRILNLPEGATDRHEDYLERVHPDDRPDFDAAWQAALLGQLLDNEHRILLKGEIRWIRQRADLSRAPGSGAGGAIGVTQDISARKLAEGSLRARDERFQLLFNRASEGILILSPKGIIVAVNESFARLHGYSPREMYNINLKDLDTPDTAPHLPLRIQRILAGETLTFEVNHYHKDGHVVPLEVTSSLIVSDGEPLIQAFHRDISERRQAQEAQRIAATAFDSQQGMMITNAQQVILRINKAFTEITGYGAEEAVGQNPRLLSSGRHDASFFSDMTESLRRIGSWQGEIWNRRKSGEVYPEWLSISVVKDDTGQTTHYVAIFTDISERKLAEDKIHDLAFYDPLTHLPNRRLLMDRISHVMTNSVRHLKKNALLFIDLDNFKALNDTLGHLQGDVLLTQVARRLVTGIRDGDTVARLGSDEFVVLLEGMSESELDTATQTKSVGEKLLTALNEDYQLDNATYHTSASIGITLFGGNQQEGADEPLKRAELAMYDAKAAGRNAMRFFDPQMQVQVSARVALEAAVREAILNQQFELFYQAQVIGTGHVNGVEVLLRWRHPLRGLVSPAEFIPLAEETGLILPIGQWVLKTACNQLALWATQPTMAHLTLAVNVSARQFHQKEFVDQVLAVLEQTGANPRRLKLELTESMLVQDVEGIIGKMNRLKMEGVSFSLDDFGTGYSSLAYLKRMPLDQLKIDQGFIKNIVTDPNDAAIARMVVALANSLGLSVIAEGVETEEQRNFLARLGCHNYQGYLFCRPVPVQDFELLATRL